MKRHLAIIVGGCPALMNNTHRSSQATFFQLKGHKTMLEKFREMVEQIREQFRLARVERNMQEGELERLRERHQRRHPHESDPDDQSK